MTVFEDDNKVAEDLAADLAVPETERRAASVLRAGREGGERCVPLLAGALADPETRVRSCAAESLRLLAERSHEHQDPPLASLVAASEALATAASDSSAEVRRGAVATLALLEASEPALDVFRRALEDPNPGVRIEGVRGLWRKGGRSAEEKEAAGAQILSKLVDEDHLVRYYAILATAELRPLGGMEALAARLGDARAEVAAEAAFVLAETGDRRSVRVLCQTLSHRDLGFEAARLLGGLGDPEAREPLRRLVDRWLGDPLTKLRAAASLAQLGDSHGEEVLMRALRSWRKPVRGFAIELLSELGSEVAFASILAVAENPRDYHCSGAARALGRYRNERGVPALCSLLRDHVDPEVREDAAWALGEIGGDEATTALARAAESDSDDNVRQAALMARRAT